MNNMRKGRKKEEKEMNQFAEDLGKVATDINNDVNPQYTGMICFATGIRNEDKVSFTSAVAGNLSQLTLNLIHAGKLSGDLDDFIESVQVAHDVLCEALTALNHEQQSRIKQN